MLPRLHFLYCTWTASFIRATLVLLRAQLATSIFSSSQVLPCQCEQKHAAIFLELSKGASPSSFFSDRKVKVRTGVISFCLDVFKVHNNYVSAANPMCFLNVHTLYQHTHMCNFSTWNKDGFFHSSLSCPLFPSKKKKNTKKEDLSAQTDSQGFSLSNPLTTICASSCRQRCSYGITVASHPFLPVLIGEGWCRSLNKVLQNHLKEGEKKKNYFVHTAYLLQFTFRVLVR